MNYKKILIATLILVAILTVGAVSASDEADSLLGDSSYLAQDSGLGVDENDDVVLSDSESDNSISAAKDPSIYVTSLSVDEMNNNSIAGVKNPVNGTFIVSCPDTGKVIYKQAVSEDTDYFADTRSDYIGLDNGTYISFDFYGEGDDETPLAHEARYFYYTGALHNLMVFSPVKLPINRIATNLTVSTAVTTTYQSGKYVLAILKDADGNPIKGAKIGFVANLKVNYVTTDATGRARFSTDNFDVGTHNVGIAYFGNSTYVPSNIAVAKVVINKVNTILAVSNVVDSYKGGKYILAILKDGNGNLVKGAKIAVLCNGKIDYAVTDIYGRARFSTDVFEEGSYNVKIRYYGGSTYHASNLAVSKVVITKVATNLAVSNVYTKVNSGKYILAILKDSTGKTISGARIGFAANGKVNYVTTDSNGRARFSTDNFQVGSYNVKIAYFGNDTYSASNKAISNVVITS